MSKAKQEGKDVQDSGNIIYEGDSSRPDKIERTYSIDGEKRELKVDNVEGSQDLLDDVKNDISEEDYENLKSVTVGVRDETNGTKTYITYDAK